MRVESNSERTHISYLTSMYRIQLNRYQGMRAYTFILKSGAMAFRQAIESAINGRDLTNAAEEYKELNEALEKWGGN